MALKKFIDGLAVEMGIARFELRVASLQSIL
jgi:hypothetical protein